MNIQAGTTPKIDFVLINSSGTEVTGLGTGFTVSVSKNGADFIAGTGTKDEIGSGWYSYVFAATETDTGGPLAVKVTGAGAIQQNLLHWVVGLVLTPITAGNDYCELAELKAKLGITDTDDDSILQQIIDAVSWKIDKKCKRRFYTTTSDESRYYSPRYPDALFLPDDVLSIVATGFQTDDDADGTYENTWATTDYELMPYNAALDGKPYTWIEITSWGDHSFPTGKKTTKLTGKFGYCAIADLPSAIREACLLQSERIYKRKDAPFGVAGTPELGMLRLQAALDPDVEVMLADYIRLDV